MGVIVFIILLLIVAVIIGLGIVRVNNTNYRTGAGMFKSSEYNLDEKDEFSDKDYYDGNGLFR
ncbi:MAG: hypothetical protein UIH27_07975 [Ruminococcus sp.]|nr:hypothetical protein [Ruminococcus sp.]